MSMSALRASIVSWDCDFGESQRLCRLMCGRPLAFRRVPHFNLGYAQLLLGHSCEFSY
jgi:hypothetical protein